MKNRATNQGMTLAFGAVFSFQHIILYCQSVIKNGFLSRTNMYLNFSLLVKGGVTLDTSIILSLISILIGLLPFFIKVEDKRRQISFRLFSAILIIGGTIFLSSAVIGFPFNLHSSHPSAPSSGQNSNVDINGDNNNVTIYNGANGDFTPSPTPGIPTSDSLDKDIDDVAVESSAVADETTDSASYDNNSYIVPVISPDKIIEINHDAILQKKGEYAGADVLLMKSEFVYLSIYEEAGFVFFNAELSTDSFMPLGGEFVTSAVVIFLDYETDDILYTVVPDEDGSVEYYPPNDRTFYVVVASSEYELYVSAPIQLSKDHGEPFSEMFVFLRKAYDTYSPEFQVRVNSRDTSIPNSNFSKHLNSDVTVYLVTKVANDHKSYRSFHYPFKTNGNGIISLKNYTCYFQINTRYLLDISLASSVYVTIDGLIKNTNMLDAYLEYDGTKYANIIH